MWLSKTIVAAAVLLSAGLAGCGSGAGKKDAARESGAAVVPRETTYLKIGHTVTGDTVYADTTSLRLLTQDGVHVYGSYLWRPPGKDGRTGAISGIRDKDTVRGMFSYTQEGGRYADSVTLVMSGTAVVITQKSAEGYPIVDTLVETE
jgi:hypothetical protein